MEGWETTACWLLPHSGGSSGCQGCPLEGGDG